MNFKIEDKRIILEEPPKRPKKITATRFGAVLGLNNWNTPFKAWCEITRTYEEPFEDTVYTLAGKAIEPKIIDYLNNRYFMSIKSPVEVYGQNYFKQTRGDFFADVEIFGGMWDAIGDDFIVEIKTTKRAEDWIEDVPIYYKLQAGLYAYLTKKSKFYVVCAFLNEGDYEQPEAFVPSAKNTIIREFEMSRDFIDYMEQHINAAKTFWEEYVLTGKSPEFDEKKDADILKELRTTVVEGDASLVVLVDRIEENQKKRDRIKAKFDKELDEIDKELDKDKTKLKNYLKTNFKEKDTKVELVGDNYIFTVSKVSKTDVDKKALEKDGLLKKYQVTKSEYRMNVTDKKDKEKEGKAK